ncbi:hypothetical protein B0920_22565 [Massilia sp. KIM]|uniref:STAS domain-containing protein n=1 Tax=Massilia sp. KIM TaxID=1955422 RepID=UPI00098F4B1C|nr:STAS domain-containing protein [Massilia sp. KIM]OON60050.1 hypothetical protein B0920_22565 [Massilia sp. KIM]
MGLFSFLKRKQDDTGAALPAPDTRMRAGEPSRLGSEAERARQREIARATAAKIDEIELEMANSIFNDEPSWGSGRRPATQVQPEPDPDDSPEPAALPASAPAVEESAILYANGQAPLAESLLRESLGDFGRHERLPWWMLFDLYQATGREQDFESIAIDYASHFETSPPAWKPLAPALAETAPALAAAERLGPVLDAGVGASLQRLLDSPAPVLRLDLGAVREAEREGCAGLLAGLQALRKGGRELVLAGADGLMAVLRARIAVGERESGEAPWLLLLELLLLSGREKDFEETAMDYCVTFEVSPPSFEAPQRVSTAAPAPAGGDRFMLPALAAGDTGRLLDAIDAYAGEREILVLDCSRLARMDYACATALLGRLHAHCGAGKQVEVRELNHLVAALLRLLGAGEPLKLFPHRY